MARVELEAVNKSFGKVQAVKDLNLTIADSKFTCLLGPSGCGKTTTLRMIAGLEHPDSGAIKIGSRTVNNLEPKDRDIAMVFETYALYPHMSVFDNIAYPLKIRKVPREDIVREVSRVSRVLGIETMLRRGIRQLSGGQRQRVALGRAMVRNPAVYLLDEPISHLDAKLRAQMRGELKRLQRSLGTTTVFVTHDQLEAMSMADYIAVMNSGELQQLGTPDEIFNHPANAFVADFVGEPPMNFLKYVFQPGPDGRSLRRDGSGLVLTDRLQSAAGRKLGASKGVAVTVGIRPQHVKIHHGEVTQENALYGSVWVTQLEGTEAVVSVKTGEDVIKVVTSSDFRVDMDEAVTLELPKEKLYLFAVETGAALC